MQHDVTISLAKENALFGAGPPSPVPRRPLKVVVHECMALWFKQTEMLAEGGDLAAQSLAGQMLLSGYGTPVDAIKGVSWLEKAAAAGDEDARKILASHAAGGR
eukprot:TRINITY_DN9190_c0_g1_i2.p2 TRINITY_DN9190_c0_g1~~TRINITY_DN9190_c0_g1_i2.p2  ORF type:complete len:104 (-),score=17.93 TRINITY_DN9190_c0_g1_i2:912-1223(-)